MTEASAPEYQNVGIASQHIKKENQGKLEKEIII